MTKVGFPDSAARAYRHSRTRGTGLLFPSSERQTGSSGLLPLQRFRRFWFSQLSTAHMSKATSPIITLVVVGFVEHTSALDTFVRTAQWYKFPRSAGSRFRFATYHQLITPCTTSTRQLPHSEKRLTLARTHHRVPIRCRRIAASLRTRQRVEDHRR